VLPLDDSRWQNYRGGYRVPYNASVPIRRLLAEGASAGLWDEMWNELHHQGDVDAASYAAAPWLVEFVRCSTKLDWNALALIAVVEIERPANPAIPPELAGDYFRAIRSLPEVIGCHPDQEWGELIVSPAVTCIALARGQRWFAKACLELDHDTAKRWFSEEFGWELDGA
jgi:hypothetical protein